MSDKKIHLLVSLDDVYLVETSKRIILYTNSITIDELKKYGIKESDKFIEDKDANNV